jgi:hypothetical protein
MKIRKFNELFNFGSKKEIKPTFKSKFEECSYHIISFLNENNIKTWQEFINSGKFDRWIIDKIIDDYCDDMKEVNEVKYLLKLQMGNKKDLKEMLQDCESNEEYEKCAEIKKKIDTIK